VSLEYRDQTQLVSFDPPEPATAWPVNYGGTTNVQQAFAGAGTAGTTYGYAQVNTSAWALQRGNNQPAMSVGDRFQIWTTDIAGEGGGSFPKLSAYSAGAIDLFDVADLIANTGKYSVVTLKENTTFTVVGMTYNSAGTTSTVYFTPVPSSGNPATTDGFVSLPAPKNPRWIGSVGHVNGLSYTYTFPGGPDSMTFTLAVPPDYRDVAINLGRIIQAYRGGAVVWEGIITEPVPSATGWNVTANGNATYGANYACYYNSWTADSPVNLAINRGMRWTNPGIGSPPGIYLGPVQDNGSIMVSDFMTLLCTGGALYWVLTPPAVSTIPAPPWKLGVGTLPIDQQTGNLTVSPTLTVSSTNPMGRSTNGVINTIIVRYMVTQDTDATSTKAATSATYSQVFVDNPQSVKAFGRQEYYVDCSTAGLNNSDADPAPITQAQAIAIGQNILTKYINANWSSSVTVAPGQLMNAGGVAMDPGCGHNINGQPVKVVLTDASYGGQVSMGPIEFLVGGYTWDEDSVTGTITPYQATGTDIDNLIAALYPGIA
jgi:hypothetical protein